MFVVCLFYIPFSAYFGFFFPYNEWFFFQMKVKSWMIMFKWLSKENTK